MFLFFFWRKKKAQLILSKIYRWFLHSSHDYSSNEENQDVRWLIDFDRDFLKFNRYVESWQWHVDKHDALVPCIAIMVVLFSWISFFWVRLFFTHWFCVRRCHSSWKSNQKADWFIYNWFSLIFYISPTTSSIFNIVIPRSILASGSLMDVIAWKKKTKLDKHQNEWFVPIVPHQLVIICKPM